MLTLTWMEWKNRIARGRNDFLSLSVEQGSDRSLSLKLLLCLEMMLCSGFSMIDRRLVSTRHSVQFHVCLSHQFVQTRGVLLLYAASTYHHHVEEGADHNSPTEHLQQPFADVEGCQPSDEVQSALSSPAQSIRVDSPVQFVIQLLFLVFVCLYHLHTVTSDCHRLQVRPGPPKVHH